jgi:hypothetical protein
MGFEAKLWLTADKLRNNMDAAEYKHVVLGLKDVLAERIYDYKVSFSKYLMWRRLGKPRAFPPGRRRTLEAIVTILRRNPRAAVLAFLPGGGCGPQQPSPET